MPNQLTFDDPIVVGDLKYAKVALARNVDDTLKRLTLDIQLYGDNELMVPDVMSMEVTNGRMTKLSVNPTPTSFNNLVNWSVLTPEDNPDVANAFDLVMGQYVTGGLTAVLNKLQELGALPEGEAA
jgi:hypothetical protein